MDVSLSIKAISESGEFEGYGSVFNVTDSYGDMVVKGAFTRSLNDMKAKSKMPALLWQHNQQEPIGVYTEIKEDENGLYVKGKLLIEDDPLAKRAFAHLKAGSITGLSIGYQLKDYEYDNAKDVFILKDIELYEVSLVTFPANDEARVSNVKNSFKKGDIPTPTDLERCLRDVGLSRNQAKAFMSKGYKALNQRDVELSALSIINSILGDK